MAVEGVVAENFRGTKQPGSAHCFLVKFADVRLGSTLLVSGCFTLQAASLGSTEPRQRK